MNVYDSHVIELERLVRDLVLASPLAHHTHPSLRLPPSTGSPETLLARATSQTFSATEPQHDLQRKYFMAPTAHIGGVIQIDDGAVMAVRYYAIMLCRY